MRQALLIATGEYDDADFKRLRSPAQDAVGLAGVLGDPTIGCFEVWPLQIDQPSSVIGERLDQFFADRRLHDVLLVHLSCHGVKDDEGRLYFAAKNTKRKQLASTAVPAAFLRDVMDRCRARSIVLLLDCCYSGAFLPGSKSDTGVHIKEQFEGKGRAILTASNAIEYSWEGDEVGGSGKPSVFTDAIIHGLKSGAADRDGDGAISINDLYEYVYEYVQDVRRNQTPLMWALGIEHGLYIARNSCSPEAKPGVCLTENRQEPQRFPTQNRNAGPSASSPSGGYPEVVHVLNHEDDVLAMALSQRGRWLATGGRFGKVLIWDALKGRLRTQISHEQCVRSIAFSPGGNWLSIGTEGLCKIFDVATGKNEGEFIGVSGHNQLSSVAFDLNDGFLATADGKTALVYNTSTGEITHFLEHESDVRSIAFSPRGHLLMTGSLDNRARIAVFHPQVNEGLNVELSLWHEGEVWSVAFHPDGKRVATGGNEGIARVWAIENGDELLSLEHDDGVRGVAFSFDGSFLATAGDDKTARIWDAHTGERITTLQHESSVGSIAFSSRENFLATCAGRKAQIWSLQA